MENVANETRGDRDHGADNCEVQQQRNGSDHIGCCLHIDIQIHLPLEMSTSICKFSQYLGKGPY